MDGKFVEHYDRNTPFENKYLPFVENVTDPVKKNQIAQQIAGQLVERQSERIDEIMNPNQKFIEAYNERQVKKNKENAHKLSMQLYNEDGKRFGRNWDYESYKTIHDPLNIFAKKGNYEDLAWKVFNDLDDSQVYLKVLYYPKLTSEDHNLLLDKFESEYSVLQSKKRFSYLLSAGSVVGTWFMAYSLRIKFPTFLFSTALAFFGTQYALKSWYSCTMKNNLNNSVLLIAKKYPQIKFSIVEYTKSEEINAAKI